MEHWTRKYTKEVTRRINAEVTSRKEMTRSKLSRKVCEWLQWKGIDGRLKEVSCRIELLKMHRAGIIKLPEARPVNFRKAAGGEKKEFYWAERNCALEDIGPVELVVIESGDRAKSRLWNKMMEEHHYLGSGPLCGKQMRYLIRGDGVPGTVTIWPGLQRLDDLTEMWTIVMNSLPPPLKIPLVSSGTYG